MNMKVLFSGMIGFGLVVAAAPAADKPVSSVKAGIVSELRSHDNAFALMMESYRQLQVLMIEADYDKRVQMAKSITNPKERDRVLLMAQHERDMRTTKLMQTVKGFDSAYDTTRKDMQRRTGGEVVTRVTPQEAGEQLRHFRAFTPKEFRMENQPSSLMPAGARMLFDDKRY